jgi:hypothetical protein
MASWRVMVAIGCIVHALLRAGMLPFFTIASRDVGLIAASHHLRLRLTGLRDCR